LTGKHELFLESAPYFTEFVPSFYTTEDRDAGIPQRALATAEAEGRFESEGWRVRKDGERFRPHVVIDAIRDPGGQLVGFAKITRDLSERKLAEEVLRRSEEQFRLLVQGVTDYAIYMLTPDGSVSSWNAGAQRIKGYEPAEIIGQHFSQFYTEEDRAAELRRKALETAATEGRLEKEGWRVRKDGTRFWPASSSTRSVPRRGRSLASPRRPATSRRNGRRRRLLNARSRSCSKPRRWRRSGSLRAHDFNNLLTAILGSLEIAKKRALSGKSNADLIDNAIQGAKRGAALTQRLLAFSRKQDLKLERVELHELVNEMVSLIERTIGPDIEIATTFPLVMPPVMSDPNQVERALLNLVVNARDAMPRGGRISIEARRRPVGEGQINGLPAGDYIVLSVADEGEGMDEETLEKATTPFFTTKGIGKGTGLGLPMIQGLMAQSGGALVLKSRKGEGTRAELWLPIAERDETQAPAAPVALNRRLSSSAR
jgi:PAS domain S-box-containing protein